MSRTSNEAWGFRRTAGMATVTLCVLCLPGLFLPQTSHADEHAPAIVMPAPEPGACAESSTEGRALYAPRSFLGYACREDDCATHKAGFAWADRQGLTQADACREAEDAHFEEGCRAFVEEAVTAEQAGFEWARENEVVEGCLCRGGGPRFEAGCEAYVAGFGR
jgi:hypothetical protein